jgi:Tol biopolymer transport system component
VSTAGHVVYRTGPGGSQRHFKWFDRTGLEIEAVGEPVTISEGAPALSPDGSALAMRRTQDGNNDIWLLQLASGALTRLTSDKANEGFPVWSADGRTIYFASNREGPFDVRQKPPVISGKEESVAGTVGSRLPKAVSPDGRYLLFSRSENIFALRLTGGPSETSVATGPGSEEFPEFSPDGRLVAYQSNDSGRSEIYIQGFPVGVRVPVTSNGGVHVRWRPDGKELFYIAPDGKLMALEIDTTTDPQQVVLGRRSALFTPPIISNLMTSAYGPQYVVSPDGQRFLVATAPRADSVTIIRNWQPKP